jgi:hypothetical protein
MTSESKEPSKGNNSTTPPALPPAESAEELRKLQAEYEKNRPQTGK